MGNPNVDVAPALDRLHPRLCTRTRAFPASTTASRVGVSLLLVTLLAGCDAGASAEASTPVPAPTAPEPPAGWSSVVSDDAGLRLSLPPWLEASDTQGAIFANEAPPGEGLQLLVEGPRQVEPQPAFGEDLRAWITARLADVGSGQPVFSEVLLPAGPALQFERLDRPGTASAWRHRAWAIRTQAGVALLWVDGPPGAWEGHLDDIARIPQFMQVTP